MAEVKEVPADKFKMVEPETGEKVGGVLKVILHESTVPALPPSFKTNRFQVPSIVPVVKPARVLMGVPAGGVQIVPVDDPSGA
jgi:hypothetical protein